MRGCGGRPWRLTIRIGVGRRAPRSTTPGGWRRSARSFVVRTARPSSRISRGPNGSGHEPAAAVRAPVAQHVLHACRAERALVGADAWRASGGSGVLGVFARRSQFEHTAPRSLYRRPAASLLSFARHPRVPVDERAVRVVPPRPRVELVERGEAAPIWTLDQLQQLALEYRHIGR